MLSPISDPLSSQEDESEESNFPSMDDMEDDDSMTDENVQPDW